MHRATLDQSIVREGERRRAHSNTCSGVIGGGRRCFELGDATLTARLRFCLKLSMMKGKGTRDHMTIERVRNVER
jgi:hypothetical protein